MPNWDDEFDFDDLEEKKKKGKDVMKVNQKKGKDEDEYFFQQQSVKKKAILPTINSRNSAVSTKQKQQSSSKQNPYANKQLGSKKVQDDYGDYQQEQIADQVIVIDSKKKVINKEITLVKTEKPTNSLGKNKSQVVDEYHEEFLDDYQQQPQLQSIKNNKSSQSVQNQAVSLKTKIQQTPLIPNKQPQKTINKLQEQQDDYQQDEFQNDDYHDDDFQPIVKSPQKTQTKKTPQHQGHKLNQISIDSLVKNNNKLPVKTNNLTIQNNKTKQPQTKTTTQSSSKPPIPQKKASKDTANSNRNLNKVESFSVNKPLKRSDSRKSIRSIGGQKKKSMKGSRMSQKNESQYLPNKHMDLVAKSFPHTQDKLASLGQAQVNKINDKMRGMIRKFNDQLNDLISKNMLLLKSKSNDKQPNVQERIRELQIQRRTGETAIQVMDKDFQKLHGREGELKQQQYQLILQKQIQQKRLQIKQSLKDITTIKRQVDTRGKKLSIKQLQQRNAQNIHHLKTILIQTKKDQEKGDQKILKLTTTQQQLQAKIADMEYKLDELIGEAREKGVSMENNDVLYKRYEEIKAKLENGKNYNKKTQALMSTKVDILNHQNQQIRIMIRNVNSQVHNLYGSIDHSQGQAIRLIQKAKEKQGVNPLFAESLDKLLKQIQQSRANNDYFDVRSEVKSRRSDSTKTRLVKNSAVEENIEKSMPLRVTQSQNKIVENQQIGMVKPKFMKKKLAQQAKLEIQNNSHLQERVWSEKQSQLKHPVKNDQNRRSVEEITKKQAQVDKVEPVEDQKKDMSKPFMLKKNKLTENKTETKQQKSIEQTPVISIPQKVSQQHSVTIPIKEQPRKQETLNISLVPRMMRFGRKKNNDQSPSENHLEVSETPQLQKVIETKEQPKFIPKTINKNQELKLEIVQPAHKIQNQQQKAIIVPKRFNLRNKAEKKDDSYTPTVQRDNSSVTSANVNIQTTQSPKQQPKEDYKPKLDFKNQQYKTPIIKEQVVVKKQPLISIEEPQIKPRFNLRLRDKVNRNNYQEEGYAPNIGQSKNLNGDVNILLDNKKAEVKVDVKVNLATNNQFIIGKETNKPADKQPVINNSYNPYAPKIQTSNPIQNKNVQINKIIPPQKQQTSINPVSNPYAAKFQTGQNEPQIANEATKRQRGPLKKNKIASTIPKENFNIYAQADDITTEVKEIGGVKTANQNVYESAISKPTTTKKEELNLNEMLGIKKETKKNDFDDLLGDIGVGNAKNKKKNNDFFSDMQF